MFGVVPKALWEKKAPADVANRITMTMRPLIVRDGSHTMLIDAGLGDKESDKFYRMRGDGDCGGFGEVPVAPRALPEHEPSSVCEIATLPQSALLYRLSGDYNPIHAARAASLQPVRRSRALGAPRADSLRKDRSVQGLFWVARSARL